MSLKEFQRALCDAVASTPRAAALRDDPDRALARYELTDRERRRLVAVAHQRGIATSAAIYRLNRVEPLCEFLPWTWKLLGDDLVTHASRFWEEHATDLQYAPEVSAFGSFLAARIRDGLVPQPHVADVLALELAANELRFASAGLLPPPSEHERMAVHPFVRVVTFATEPGALLGALAADGPLPPVSADEHLLLVDGRGPALRMVPLRPELGRRLLELSASADDAGASPLDDELAAAGLIA